MIEWFLRLSKNYRQRQTREWYERFSTDQRKRRFAEKQRRRQEETEHAGALVNATFALHRVKRPQSIDSLLDPIALAHGFANSDAEKSLGMLDAYLHVFTDPKKQATVYQLKGEIYQNAGDKRAEECYREAALLDPTPARYTTLARFYIAENRITDAVQVVERHRLPHLLEEIADRVRKLSAADPHCQTRGYLFDRCAA